MQLLRAAAAGALLLLGFVDFLKLGLVLGDESLLLDDDVFGITLHVVFLII